MKEKESFNANMNLQDYYQSLENQRTILIKKLQKATGKSYRSIQNYLTGATTPDKPTRKVISEIIGISEDTLWPELEKSVA